MPFSEICLLIQKIDQVSEKVDEVLEKVDASGGSSSTGITKISLELSLSVAIRLYDQLIIICV